MTATELIIAFLLEDDVEDNPFEDHPQGWRKGDEWKHPWVLQVRGKLYSGAYQDEAVKNAFNAGAFPEYSTVKELFHDIPNARRKYQWEFVERPPRPTNWQLGGGHEPVEDWRSLIPTRVMTGDDVLDVYQRTKKYRKGSLNREKLMQQVRQMAAKLESQRLRL